VRYYTYLTSCYYEALVLLQLLLLLNPMNAAKSPSPPFSHNLFVNITIFLLQNYVVKMDINSIRHDVKLVFTFTENMNPADINSSPDGHWTPNHVKVLNAYL